MFLTQLRAILRASQHGPVRLLIPMLAHGHEIDQSLPLHRRRLASSAARARLHFDARIAVGGMIEVPAAALTRRAVRAQAGLPLDRHQRPDPVHAGHRPGRQHGRCAVRSASSGRAAADGADDPRRRACRQSGGGLRRDGRRPRGHAAASGHGLEGILDASGPRACCRSSRRSCAAMRRASGRRVARLLSSDDPVRMQGALARLRAG